MVAYLEKSDDNTEFHQIVNFLSSCSITYALTQIHVVVDGKAVVISESLVRSDLLFDDEDGGRPKRQETMGGTSAQTMSERVLEQPNEPPLKEGHTFGSGEDRLEENIELTDIIPTPYDSPLTRGYKPGSDEGKITLAELMKTYTILSNRKRSKAVIHSSDEEGPSMHIKYSPKQGKIIKEIDKDENINLYAKELAKEEARQEQERYNLEKGLELQRQLDQRKETVPKGSSKKQRLDQQSEEEAKAQGDSDQEVEELKNYMRIIHEEDIEIEAMPLAIKPLVIIEYKIVKEVQISTYHIKRADGSTKRYTSMINLLKNIDREDLETLWKLVKDKYSNTRLEEGFKNLHIFLLVDKVYPLTPATIKMMLERKLQTDQWNKMCYQLFKLMMKQLRKQSSVWKNPLRV
nr:hypothetical protein [Tanacetum cinerariifolium]